MADAVGWRDTGLDVEPTLIVCAACAEGYDLTGLHPIDRAEADSYGDACHVCRLSL